MNIDRLLFGRYQNEAGEGEGAGSGAGEGEGEGSGGAAGVMQQAGGWGWNEDTPGEGERPEWLAGKFKTVEDQAKNYANLEQMQGKYGNYFGAPEADYALSVPEGIEGDFDADHPDYPVLEAFMATAKEMGLSQAAFDKILHPYIEHNADMLMDSAARVARVAQDLGETGEQVISDTWARLNQAVGPEHAAALDGVVQSAEGIRALQALLKSEAVLPADGGETGGKMTRDELRALRFQKFPEGHPKAGREMYGADQAHTKKVDEAYNLMYPGEDRQQVG